jgi:hypothetical protein
MTKNWDTAEKNIVLFFLKKIVQAAKEAFCPQKRKSSTANHEISLHFPIFMGPCCPPESGSNAQEMGHRGAGGGGGLSHW